MKRKWNPEIEGTHHPPGLVFVDERTKSNCSWLLCLCVLMIQYKITIICGATADIKVMSSTSKRDGERERENTRERETISLWFFSGVTKMRLLNSTCFNHGASMVFLRYSNSLV